MHSENVQAFVLSHCDYGESDRIVSLFTLEHGRMKGFARGARNSRKRFGAALEPFARIDLQLTFKDGLSPLRSADIVMLYPGIRGDLGSIAHALYACELTEALTPEAHPLPRLFRLLTSYLEHIDSGCHNDADRRMFEINVLNLLGYRPALDSCGRCGGEFDAHGALLHRSGELLCRYCGVGGRPLPAAALQWLNRCLATSRFGYAPVDTSDLAASGILLDAALTAHVSRKLKSLDFLLQVSPLSP